jgi:hypothetical protein
MNLIAYDGQIELEEDDWLDADESERGPDDDEDEWECAFGADCLMSSRHMRLECYTVEMAEAWAEEQEKERQD